MTALPSTTPRLRKQRLIPLTVLPFVIIVAALVILALAAPWVAPVDPNTQNLLARLKAPARFPEGSPTGSVPTSWDAMC